MLTDRPYKRKYRSNVIFDQVIKPQNALIDPFRLSVWNKSDDEFIRAKIYKHNPNRKHIKRSTFFTSTRWAVITLFGIMIFTFILGMLANMYIQDAKADEALSQINQVKVTQLGQVNKENEVLKDKLLTQMNTAKVDPRTKTIVQHYITQYFGKEAAYAEKVFTCESGLHPEADGVNKNGSHDRGVPQINDSNHKSFEKVTGLDYSTFAHDTETSIKYAKWLRDNSRGGWSNWVCSGLIDGRKA